MERGVRKVCLKCHAFLSRPLSLAQYLEEVMKRDKREGGIITGIDCHAVERTEEGNTECV
jgi:hypothetical protein